MCPPQAQAEVGPTMTEKAEMVCAPSPAPAPPPKPASPGPPQVEEVGHRGGSSPPRLPPGVPVISLGHSRPPGAAMPTTELGTLRPPLLQLSTLRTAPPTLALHYHPHPFLNSVYIGPAGPFSVFPSSRLKRRPSHCELDLAEGECGFVCLVGLHACVCTCGCTEGRAISVWGSCLSSTPTLGERCFQHTQRTAHTGSTHVHNRSPIASPTQPPPRNRPGLVAAVMAKQSMPYQVWEPQNDSSTRMCSHAKDSHKTTAMQETATGPQPHTRQPQDHSHLGPWPHKNQPHNHSHS
uniref:LYL1 basic helix-loop-helix family member n=1 Tax=Macaca mulatta TaxID=9544 RepID=A0A1D5Q8V9_MACMU